MAGLRLKSSAGWLGASARKTPAADVLDNVPTTPFAPNANAATGPLVAEAVAPEAGVELEPPPPQPATTTASASSVDANNRAFRWRRMPAGFDGPGRHPLARVRQR